MDYECECSAPGPPPGFDLPPPPRPHFLYEVGDCSDTPLLEFESCDYMTVIDAEYHISPVIPPLAITVISAFLFLALAVLATALFWKHKNKMQNLFPCKRSRQNHYNVTDGNDVIYEDLTDIRPRCRALPKPSMEMIVVNTKENYVNKCTYSVMSHSHAPVFFCQGLGNTSQDLYNQVYEELSNGSEVRGDSDGESVHGHGHGSEAEFAEDELSMGEGIVVGDCPDQAIRSSPQTFNDAFPESSSDIYDRSGFLCPRNLSFPSTNIQDINTDKTTLYLESFDRRRHGNRKKTSDFVDYHEGILLDTYFQMYPSVVVPGNITQPINQTRNCHRLPFILPVAGPITTHSNFEGDPDLSGLQPLHPMFTYRPMKHDMSNGYRNNSSRGGHSEMQGYKRDCETNEGVLK